MYVTLIFRDIYLLSLSMIHMLYLIFEMNRELVKLV